MEPEKQPENDRDTIFGDSGRRRDPELLAMERIIHTMEDLDDKARGRCIAYLSARYAPVY